MASTPMRPLIPGRLFWAIPGVHLKPGVVLWTGRRHVRLLAVPNRRRRAR